MRYPRLVAMLLALLALVGLAVAATAPAAGQVEERSTTWSRYDVALEVRADGSIAVTETQEIRFQGTFQRGYRVIPTARTTGITDVSVSEIVDGREVAYARGSSRPNTFDTSLVDGDVRVDWWFPQTTNASRTFVLRYVARGAVRLYDAGDQLQWRAVYPDRNGEVQSSTIVVRLPTDAPPDAIRTAFYRIRPGEATGAAPQAGSGEVLGGGQVRFVLDRLPPNQGVEVRVQFPSGAITAGPPPWQAAADRADWVQQTVAPIGRFLSLFFAVAILAGGGAGLLLLWYSTGRDPGIGRVPPRLDSPPSDLPAPLAGTLVDEVADVQDAVAALVDLAQRGVVTLVDEVNPQLAGSTRDVRLTLEVPPNDPGLRRYERTLLAALLGPDAAVGQTILLSGAKQRFATAVPILQEQLHRAVAEEGLFARDPHATRRRYRTLGWLVVALGVLAALAMTLLLGSLVPRVWLPGAALAVVGLGLLWLARVMPRRTPQGALEAARWRAFRAYLADESKRPAPGGQGAEAKRELPYAVAFGIDRTFLHKLETVGAPPPTWYGRHVETPGGVVILPGGWYGGPWMGAPAGHGRPGGPDRPAGADTPTAVGGLAGPGVPNPQGWSDALADLLNAASQAMAQGGGSGGWSGGGFGGGGGGGGGSGGFN